MNSQARRLRLVYGGLVAATLVATVLSLEDAQNLLSTRGAVSVATIIAFIKVRYVILDFMELRGTGISRAFDAWILIVGAMSLGFVVR